MYFWLFKHNLKVIEFIEEENEYIIYLEPGRSLRPYVFKK